jgi:hypothetical protein
MTVRIVSFEAQVKAAIQAQLAGNLEDAISYFEDRLKAKISVQGPPRSTPGSPPKKDTGYLHDESISHEVDAANLVARCGSDAPYAAELEVIYNRPYFTSTIIEEADEIGRRACKP